MLSQTEIDNCFLSSGPYGLTMGPGEQRFTHVWEIDPATNWICIAKKSHQL